MELTETREFPFPMEVAWEALHHTASLDIDTGSIKEKISDTEWESYVEGHPNEKSHYQTTFYEEQKKAVIESTSTAKRQHDFTTLALTAIDENHVSLKVDMVINLGMHLFARVSGFIIKESANKIIFKAIFKNFEALCKGEEVQMMSAEELNHAASNLISEQLKDTKE